MWQMVIANIRVAYHILIPSAISNPGVIGYPLKMRSDTEITILSIIISLTPGSLALDVSEDKKTLFIHTMFADEKEFIIDDIHVNLEKPIMRILG
tara:strand:+ start:191 stop:475 length:285 start_codon:yes stop_codon:yes gene_type:complete